MNNFHYNMLRKCLLSFAFLFAAFAVFFVFKPHTASAFMYWVSPTDFILTCYNQESPGVTMMAGSKEGIQIRPYGLGYANYSSTPIDISVEISNGTPIPFPSYPNISYFNNPTSSTYPITLAYISTTSSTTPGTYTLTFTGDNGGYSRSCSYDIYVTANPGTVTGTITCDGQLVSCNVDVGSQQTIAWNTTGASFCFIVGVSDEFYGFNSGLSGSFRSSPFYNEQMFTRIKCYYGGGIYAGTVAIVSVNAKPSASIYCNSAESCTVAYGDTAMLNWSSTYASDCTVNPGGWPYTAAWQTTDEILATTTYTLSCNGLGGSASDTVTATVPSTPNGTITCSDVDTYSFPGVSDCSVPYNTPVRIDWSTSNTTSCSVSAPGWTGTSGSHVTSALTSNTTYYLYCYGTGAYASVNSLVGTANVTVTAPPTPSGSITCNGLSSCTIPYNTAATIAWTSSNTTSCSVSPSGWTGTSGSQSTGALTSSGTYTLSCTGPAGSLSPSPSVTVTVDGDFSLNCTPLSTSIARGDATSYQLSISRINGFTGAVTFSGPGFSPSSGTLPSNSFINNPQTNGGPTASSVISTSSSTTLAAPYTITYTATAGSLSHTCSVSLYISAALPVEPVNVVITNSNCGTIDVAWDQGLGTNPAGFKVYRRTQGTGLASDSWTELTSMLSTGLASHYTYRDNSPLLPSGSNYYSVTSYDSNGLESAKVLSSPTSIVPVACAPSLSTSDLDVSQVSGRITKTFTPVVCSASSEVATLPNNALFSVNDTVTFKLNVCNSGTLDMSGISAHLTFMNLSDFAITSYSPPSCVTGQTIGASTMDFTLADIAKPPLGTSANSCIITYTGRVTLPSSTISPYQRFQSTADISASGGLSARVQTPPYLFGITGKDPNRAETAPY